LDVPWWAAERLSASPTPPGAGTADLERALAEQDLGADFLTAMRGERALGLAASEGDKRVFPRGPADRLYHREGALARGFELGTLDYWERALPIMAEPSVTSVAKLTSLGRPRVGWRGGVGVLAAILAPIFPRAVSKRDQTQARLDLWRLALALRRYRAAHGQYPTGLDQLGQPVLQDPFSGKPYVYRPQGTGFLVYSFGPDMRDDGGKSQYDAQGKFHEKGDIVWRCER
jgi:hypothetical protein